MMMVERKNRLILAAFFAFILSGCSVPQQENHFSPQARPIVHTEAMELACKNQAAFRYNTQPQRINLSDFKQYQASYEMMGSTARKEGFTCSFDESGQFSHLSSRENLNQRATT
jgi:uncharacterized lipoprotein YajG